MQHQKQIKNEILVFPPPFIQTKSNCLSNVTLLINPNDSPTEILTVFKGSADHETAPVSPPLLIDTVPTSPDQYQPSNNSEQIEDKLKRSTVKVTVEEDDAKYLNDLPSPTGESGNLETIISFFTSFDKNKNENDFQRWIREKATSRTGHYDKDIETSFKDHAKIEEAYLKWRRQKEEEEKLKQLQSQREKHEESKRREILLNEKKERKEKSDRKVAEWRERKAEMEHAQLKLVQNRDIKRKSVEIRKREMGKKAFQEWKSAIQTRQISDISTYPHDQEWQD